MYAPDAYGYVFNPSGDPRYHCIDLGAKDSTSNNSVSALINALIAAGYTPRGKSKISYYVPFVTSSDELFDGAVKEAVQAFQRDYKLLQTGRVDEATWKALGMSPTLIQACGSSAAGGGVSFDEPVQGVQVPRGVVYDRIWNDLTLLHGRFQVARGSGNRGVKDSRGYLFLQFSDGRLYVVSKGSGDSLLDALLGDTPKAKSPFPLWTIPVGLVAIGGAYWAWKKWR
jgi:hypothetical protein